MLRFASKRMLIVGALAVMGVLGMLALSLLREHLPFRWKVPLRAWWSDIRIDEGIRIRSADGTELSATLLLPEQAREPLPTIYLRSPYGRRTGEGGLGDALFFARHGYAVLVQDVRGTGDSGGEFMPWQHAGTDGAATLVWVAAQPWANGRVGTFGCSALGELQFPLARLGDRAHQAMIASGAGGAIGSARGQFGYFGIYEGGIFQLASGFGWFAKHGAQRPELAARQAFDTQAALRSLPIAELVHRVAPGANGYREIASLPLADRRWSSFDYVMQGDHLFTPALLINTWGDQTLAGTLALADIARGEATLAGKVKVILAPGDHCEHASVSDRRRWGEVDITNATRPYDEWALAWFAHWLRDDDNGIDALPDYQFFVLGENRWLASRHWPPDGARPVRWYLDSDGHANAHHGDGRLSVDAPSAAGEDSYRYDPHDPVPSRGGPVCCTGDPRILPGPRDQAEVEARDDVLVYTSPPLDRPLRIAGNLRARLWVAISTMDTDLVARLVDVAPDGHALNIQEGALRLRYRDGIARPSPMPIDTPVEVSIDMRAIAWRLPVGHRLRLDLSSSSFPRLARNLNDGGDPASAEVARIARVRVLHGGAQPSVLELDVLADADVRDAPSTIARVR